MQLKTDITQSQMDDLCFASFQLLQTMSNIYGSDPAYEMFQKLEEVLGPEVKSHLFLKMLDSTYSNSRLAFTFKGVCTNVINMIKSARTYAVDEHNQKLGLKEAKDIIDAALHGGIGRIYFMDGKSRQGFIQDLKANGGQVV